MPRALNLRGKRYGRLVVLDLTPGGGRGATPGRWWRCRCDCGATCDVSAQSLRSKHPVNRTRSCGCLQRENVARQSPLGLRAAAEKCDRDARSGRYARKDA